MRAAEQEQFFSQGGFTRIRMADDPESPAPVDLFQIVFTHEVLKKNNKGTKLRSAQRHPAVDAFFSHSSPLDLNDIELHRILHRAIFFKFHLQLLGNCRLQDGQEVFKS